MGKLTNVTVKGQVTIPKDVRDALGLVANQPVEIEMLGEDAAVIRKPKRDRDVELARLIDDMKAASDEFAHLREGQTTDEIMREIRGDGSHWP